MIIRKYPDDTSPIASGGLRARPLPNPKVQDKVKFRSYAA